MLQIINGEIVFTWLILPITLVIGLFLVLSRPYSAFIFATFISIAFGQQTLLFTKIPGMGFISLLDICLIISIAAWIKEILAKKQGLILPKPAIACLIVLFIGFFQSAFRYDQFYLTVRSLRWAIGLPIFFIITANLVTDEKRVKSLLWVLLIGGILASLQHGFWLLQVGKTVDIFTNPELLRNISFLRNQESWLIAGPFIIARRIPKPWLQLAVAILFLGIFLTQQTRSLAIGVIGAIIIYYLWFVKDSATKQKGITLLVIVFLGALMLLQFSNFSGLAENYLERLLGLTDTEQSYSSLDTRQNTFNIEMRDWWQGNVILGEGLFYYQRVGYGLEGVTTADIGRIAYNHLGYVAYLSQLGVVGFLVYGIWLPISVVLRAKQVFNSYTQIPAIRYMAAITGSTFISSIIIFTFSSSFISGYVVIPGIIAGPIWRFSNHLRKIRRIQQKHQQLLANYSWN